MSVSYYFLLTSRGEPKIPHVLELNQNQRTGRFEWKYFQVQGKIKMMPPKASGTDVRFGPSGAQFDLYANGSPYGTLTLKNKSLKMLVVGDAAEFKSFTGSVDDAAFTGNG